MKRIAGAILAVALIFALPGLPANAAADDRPGALTRGEAVYNLYYHLSSRPPVITNHGAFTDTAGAFYSDPADWAAEIGIMQGVSEGVFAGDLGITRAQASVIVSRYLKWKGVVPATIDTTDISACRDYSQVPSWARAEMAQAVAYGIIETEDGLLSPNEPLFLTQWDYIVSCLSIEPAVNTESSSLALLGNADYSGAVLIDLESGRELSLGMTVPDVEALLGQELTRANWYSHNLGEVIVNVSFGRISALGIIDPESSFALNGDIRVGFARESVEAILGEPLVLPNGYPIVLYYFNEDGQLDNTLTKPAYVVQMFYAESADGALTIEGDLLVGLVVTISNEYVYGEGYSALPSVGAFRQRESGAGSRIFKADLSTRDNFFEISHKGAGDFIIRQNDEILFSCKGDYHGRVILSPANDLPLTVDTQGEWTIIDIFTNQIYFPLAGSGDWVSLHALSSASLNRLLYSDYSKVRISHKGSGDVLVRSLSRRPNAEERDVTVLLSGTGDCSVTLDLPLSLPEGERDVVQFFEIVTDGAWVFELVQ